MPSVLRTARDAPAQTLTESVSRGRWSESVRAPRCSVARLQRATSQLFQIQRDYKQRLKQLAARVVEEQVLPMDVLTCVLMHASAKGLAAAAHQPRAVALGYGQLPHPVSRLRSGMPLRYISRVALVSDIGSLSVRPPGGREVAFGHTAPSGLWPTTHRRGGSWVEAARIRQASRGTVTRGIGSLCLTLHFTFFHTAQASAHTIIGRFKPHTNLILLTIGGVWSVHQKTMDHGGGLRPPPWFLRLDLT